MFVWVPRHKRAVHIALTVSTLLHFTILLIVCQVISTKTSRKCDWEGEWSVICLNTHLPPLHSPFSANTTLCDCFHDANVRALTPVDVALDISPINPSKPMIQYSWFVVHYTTLLPDNVLDTTMTILRVLIIFMIIIHDVMNDQQKVHYSTCSVGQIIVNEYTKTTLTH